MRNIIFTLLITANALIPLPLRAETGTLTTSTVAESSQVDARTILQRVADYIRSLGAYDAEFRVRSGDYSTTGQYSVAGDAYHIKVDRAEVYSDGSVRYEVDLERKEINVDNMDLASRNIMDNPTRCFDFVGDDYSSEVIHSENGRSTLHLKATDPAIEGDIYLEVQEHSGRPMKIVYTLYEDRVEVDVTSLESRRGKVESFSQTKFAGYDVVDFR